MITQTGPTLEYSHLQQINKGGENGRRNSRREMNTQSGTGFPLESPKAGYPS
jgi:hypothetical protein